MFPRWLAAVAVSAAVAATGAPAARAEPPVFASVYFNGVSAGDYGGANGIAIGGAGADAPRTKYGYGIRSTPGGDVTGTFVSGYSIYRILQAAGVSAGSVDVVG